ncbi:hypothetical protein ACI3PH_16175 [Lactococcus lactis]
MAELTKVYRGMQNGAETIDGNFKALNDELSTSTSETLNIGNGLSIKFPSIVSAPFCMPR